MCVFNLPLIPFSHNHAAADCCLIAITIMLLFTGFIGFTVVTMLLSFTGFTGFTRLLLTFELHATGITGFTRLLAVSKLPPLSVSDKLSDCGHHSVTIYGFHGFHKTVAHFQTIVYGIHGFHKTVAPF